MLQGAIQSSTPLLCRLDIAVLATENNIGFITSDHPCVWFDPAAYRRSPMYRSPALEYSTIEITMPVSPTQCIFLNRQGMRGYVNVPEETLDEINRRTRCAADEHFVVRINEKKDIWFDLGEVPDDH